MTASTDRLIHLVLDGEATPDERRTLERLAAADPDVAERQADARRLLAALDGLPQKHPPEGLVAAVMAKIPQKPSSGPGRQPTSDRIARIWRNNDRHGGRIPPNGRPPPDPCSGGHPRELRHERTIERFRQAHPDHRCRRAGGGRRGRDRYRRAAGRPEHERHDRAGAALHRAAEHAVGVQQEVRPRNEPLPPAAGAAAGAAQGAAEAGARGAAEAGAKGAAEARCARVRRKPVPQGAAEGGARGARGSRCPGCG